MNILHDGELINIDFDLVRGGGEVVKLRRGGGGGGGDRI